MGPVPDEGADEEVLRDPALLSDPAQVNRVPLPHMLLRFRRSAEEAEAAFQREWEILEAERQQLGDWHARLEERTKDEASRGAFERSQPLIDREAYKKDLRKVFDQEAAVASWENVLKPREKAIAKEEARLTGLQSELEARGQELEASSESLRKWRQELEETASK
jgi:hypothetical protein